MVIVELVISSVKLIIIYFAMAALCVFLVFKIMAFSSLYFYNRGIDFYTPQDAYVDSAKVSSVFKPVFKKTKIVPLINVLKVEAVFADGKLKHEMFVK